MANNNDLTQLTNQEAILEEINEEQLDEVVGGLTPVFNLLYNVVGVVEQFALELNLTPPRS